MNHNQFKKLINEGSDIDHETAMEMIELMWPHFDKCANLMKKECIDDSEEILNDMFIADAETAKKVGKLAKEAHWSKKSTGKTQIVAGGKVIGEAG